MSRLRFQPKVTYDFVKDQGTGPHEFAQAEVETARWVGTKLERWYPGHAWHVQCDIRKGRGNIRGGVIGIRINGLMPPNYFYRINMRDLLTDAGGRIVMKAGGELLERYRVPRGNFDMDHWRQALNAQPLISQKTGRGWHEPLR